MSTNMHTFELKKRQLLASLIAELEVALKAQKLWQLQLPSEQALASREPFAIDSLTFPQWLQFIFIEKMSALLELNLALPTKVAIAPMASEYFKELSCDSSQIVAIITRIDLTLNETPSC